MTTSPTSHALRSEEINRTLLAGIVNVIYIKYRHLLVNTLIFKIAVFPYTVDLICFYLFAKKKEKKSWY